MYLSLSLSTYIYIYICIYAQACFFVTSGRGATGRRLLPAASSVGHGVIKSMGCDIRTHANAHAQESLLNTFAKQMGTVRNLQNLFGQGHGYEYHSSELLDRVNVTCSYLCCDAMELQFCWHNKTCRLPHHMICVCLREKHSRGVWFHRLRDFKQYYVNSHWVFITGGCSGGGVQWIGVVLYNKLIYNTIQITAPVSTTPPFDES